LLDGLWIGNVRINGNIVLAPMAGVTDMPFRIICKEMGADLVYTEMISAKGLLYDGRNTEALLATSDMERPVSVQLFGNDPYVLGEQARKIEDRNFDILDINMGCPVTKVVRNGEGCALMKEPKRIGEIIRSVTKAIKKPVTIKIRKGYDESGVNAVECAKVAEDGGVSAIAVHGRTRDQLYGGKVDMDVIRQVKDAVSVPIIGNGDVFTPEQAKEMLLHTGCDAVMVARGVRGNPWLIRQIKAYLIEEGIINGQEGHIYGQEGHGGAASVTARCNDGQVGYDEVASMTASNIYGQARYGKVLAMMLRHAKMEIDYRGEHTAMREMRKHFAWYMRGFPGSSRLRGMANKIGTLEDLVKLISVIQDNP